MVAEPLSLVYVGLSQTLNMQQIFLLTVAVWFRNVRHRCRRVWPTKSEPVDFEESVSRIEDDSGPIFQSAIARPYNKFCVSGRPSQGHTALEALCE